MEVVIADANIFVYFFRTNVINKILSSSELDIKITKTVYEELTEKYRIPTEYPDLRDIIIDAVHNTTSLNRLECIDVHKRELNTNSLSIYYTLDNQGNLDPGELDSIPLAYDLNSVFVTNDEDAISTANEIGREYGRVAALAVAFTAFCLDLRERRVIDNNELMRINALFE